MLHDFIYRGFTALEKREEDIPLPQIKRILFKKKQYVKDKKHFFWLKNQIIIHAILK